MSSEQHSPVDGAQLENDPKKPGRPRRTGPTKVPITIRLDMDVLSALKRTGPGWQTRVNRVVRQWILEEQSPAGNSLELE